MQYDLRGTFHQDYQQGGVNRRRPNEQPSLIIFLALNEFKFQYKNDTLEGELETVSFPIGQAAIFQVHSVIVEGQMEQVNRSIVCLSTLFQSLVDYLDGTIEIDHENDDQRIMKGGGGGGLRNVRFKEKIKYNRARR